MEAVRGDTNEKMHDGRKYWGARKNLVIAANNISYI